ncbi:hypothetical protein C3V37_03530 [Peptostreptococcaceae bacterium oral taxon 929]|nr:hypothetical protein C3V37_03530 [Peptostreptococcaceae bacterium oral taxon 929]
MNRKIRVIILTMVLTVLLFGGTRLMAQDLSNKPSETQTTPDEEKSKEEGSLAKTNENEEGSESADSAAKDTTEDNNGAVLPKGSDNPDLNKTATENNNENIVKEAPKTKAEGAKTLGEKAKTEEQVKAQEENKAKEEGSGKEDGAKANPQEAPLAEPNKEEQGAPEKKTEEKKNDSDKPQIDTKTDKDLNDLQAKINAEQDPKKKAELQKEYNEKYLEKVEAAGADKTDPNIQERLTKDEDIKKYNIIKAKQEELKQKKEALEKKIAEGKASEKDIEAFKKSIEEYNNLLGSFQPPRALTPEEQEAAKLIGKEPYYPGLAGDSKTKYDAYLAAKKALEEDPENETKNAELKAAEKNLGKGEKAWKDYQEAKEALEAKIYAKEPSSDEEIKKLLEAYKKTIDPLKEAIGEGKLKLKFAQEDGKPEVWIFPLDHYGIVDKRFGYDENNQKDWQSKDTYYIADDTDVNLIVQVHRNDADANQDFTFTITPDQIGKYEPKAKLEATKEIAYINGKPIELKPNTDGSYTFTVKAGETNFGIAQLTLKVNGFSAPFHNGFELKMKAGTTEKSKKFLITKKGYEDEADLNGPGLKKPGEELTEEDKKDVPTISAGPTENGIVVENTKVLQDFFVELEKAHGYIDKEILVNSANGKSLPLSSVDITITVPKHNGNFAKFIHESGLEYVKIAEGKYQLKLKVKEIGGDFEKAKNAPNAELKDIILVNEKGEKVYIDESSKIIKIAEREVLKGKINVNGTETDYKIYKDKEDTKLEINGNTLTSKNNTWKVSDTTYKLEGDKLISYTDVKDVYEGNVSNDIDSNEEKSANKEVTPTFKGKQVIVTKDREKSYGGTIIENGIFKEIKDSEGKVLETKYIGQNVEDDNIPQGFIKKALALIDKFGLLMDTEVKKEGAKYKFIKKVNGAEQRREIGGTYDGLSISLSKKDQIFVDNKNMVKDDSNREAIVGKYYYDDDGEKFMPADPKAIVDDKVYINYNKSTAKKSIEFLNADDGNKVLASVSEKTNKIYGSHNPDDYFTIDNKTYYRENIGTDEEPKYRYILAKVKDSAEIISEEKTYKIVQIINGNEVIKKGTDIFDAVNNAKFQLRFPGFFASDKTIYHIKVDIKANYFAPNENKPDEFVEKSIFKDEDLNNGYYSFSKHFKLRSNETGLGRFFKTKPEEFKNLPDYNLFNIIYRDSNDRQRDDFIKALVELRKNHKPETENDKEKAKKIKEQIEFLEKLEKSLSKIYGKEGLKFAKNGKDQLVVVDSNNGNKEFEVKRSLLWNVGFNNEDGILFPTDADTQITIDDYNMDNRLVYDEIIINNTRKIWEKAKADKGENFEGNGKYFFLDQLSKIILGVNPKSGSDSKDKVEDIYMVGKDFVITRAEIENALKTLDANNEGKIEKKDSSDKVVMTYKLTYNPDTAQIRIKVLNAFYNKDFRTDEFKSPVQKAYDGTVDKLTEAVEKINFKNDDESLKSDEDLKKEFESLIANVFPKESACYKTLNEKFSELLKNKDKNAKKELIEKINEAIKSEDRDTKLNNDGSYKYDDMRYNGIRFIMEPNIQIGGPFDVSKIKQIGITSVIVPEVDIPFTDEFGRALTNKVVADKNKSDPKILVKVKDDKGNDIAEDEIKDKVIKAADNFQFFYKDENEVPFYIYSAKLGKELGFIDLAIKGKDEDGNEIYKALLDRNGDQINKYFAKTGKKGSEARINMEEIDKQIKAGKLKAEVKEILDEIINSPIDLYSYYVNKDGANREFYENKASYELFKAGQGPRIFGYEDNWKYRICPEGILGHCLEKSGADKKEERKKGKELAGVGGNAGDKISLDYSIPKAGPDDENPKFDKTSPDDKKHITITEDEDITVDFTIKTSVDKIKQAEQEAKNILIEDAKKKEEADKKLAADIKNGYYKDGFFVYKNSFIIDVLPDIFKIIEAEDGKKGTKIDLELNKDALMANGANAKFKDDKEFKKFKEGIKYLYVEDVYDYLSQIKDPKQRKAFVDQIKAKGIEKGQRAIIVKLPEFQAPHGSSDSQFTVTIKNLLVDKKKYQEAEKNNNQGQIYTNHALFSGEGTILYDKEDTNITDGHKGNVNKYLRIYDKDGKIINVDTDKEWFKGNVELKFGDIFDYKIKVRETTNIVDTGIGNTLNKTVWEMDDNLPTNEFGLKPVIRDFVKVPDNLEVIYYIGGKPYKESDIKEQNLKLSDVSKIKVQVKDGKTFKINEDVSFEIPMKILDMDAKIENGKIKYIGTDGKEIVRDAEEFFNLAGFKEKDTDLLAKNSVEKSNTVKVYLEKQKFVKIFKEFFDREGKKINENLPDELEFVITDESGKSETIILKKENNFEGKSGYLPWYKKTVTFDKDGNAKVSEEEIKYNFTVKEKDSKGYILEVEKVEEDEYKIAIVFKAKNTEKPEIPPEYPKDHPKNVKVKITVNKVWKVLNGGSTPSIQVELYANGEATGKIITLGADGSWSASFEDLPSKDANGKEIIYTVREIGESNELTKIDDRTFEVIYTGNLKDGFTIINKEIPPDDEKPKDKKELKKHKPNDEEGRDRTPKKNRIPKTGVNEDLGAIYFAFVLLLGLVFIKKRYLVK